MSGCGRRAGWLVMGWFFLFAPAPAAHGDDWPQWLGPRRDGMWGEMGVAQTFPASGPVVRWRVPVAGGYAGPAVAGGRVYLMDRVTQSGTRPPTDPSGRDKNPGIERVLCFNAKDGSLLWKHEYDCPYTVSYAAGPRCTPTVEGDRVYTLGAEGHLFCLDAESGKVIWERRAAAEEIGEDGKPTGRFHRTLWGFTSHPLIDGDKLIVLTTGPAGSVTAFDKRTGERIWSALPAREPGYAPPVIFDPGQGGARRLIVWHPESLNSVDPETGKVHWSEPFGPVQNGVSIVSPLVVRHPTLGDVILVSGPNEGTMLVKIDAKDPAAHQVLWRRKANESFNLLMARPVARGDYVYGISYGGDLKCIKLADGGVVWQTYDAVQGGDEPVPRATAFLVPLGDGGRVVIANEKGDLILADLSPQGYKQVSRAHVLDPTNADDRRLALWSHPAFANRCVYWKNDKELVCVSLAAEAKRP